MAFTGFLTLLVVFLSTTESARVIPRPLIRKTRSISTEGDSSISINYAVIFDAGSTGTRTRVYRYILTGDQEIFPEDISEMPIKGTAKVRPGISSYHEDPEKAGESLIPLIEGAKATIPEQYHSNSKLFLFATAGIRSLQLDPNTKEAADKIFANIRSFLSEKENNPFVFQNDFARVISGQEESVFSWITVNWLKGVLTSGKTVGTLDLGGSSAEVGYEYDTNDQNTFKLTFKKSEKLVYSIAHEHFGTNEARKLHLIKTIERRGEQSNLVTTPCYNKGYNEMFTYKGKEYKIVGTGNAFKCSVQTRKLFTTENSCMVEPCNLNTTNQPELTGPLYIFSGFYYNLKGIGVLVSDCEQTVTLSQINQNLRPYCKKTAAEIEELGDDYAKYNCFVMSYSKALIINGYKVNLDESSLIAVGEIKGVKIGWTLGAVLYNLDLL